VSDTINCAIDLDASRRLHDKDWNRELVSDTINDKDWNRELVSDTIKRSKKIPKLSSVMPTVAFVQV
jgi:hypothetical protein